MLHKTIVFITHDFLEALRLGDRIAIMRDGWVVQIGTPAEVVMNPANDYVAEFTQDVPRVRVITVNEVFEPADDGMAAEKGVSPNTTLEELMPLFANHASGVAVVEDGKVIGKVTPRGVVNALARSGENA
jgi:glycine betaine/proline transport system ATP-binding protein